MAAYPCGGGCLIEEYVSSLDNYLSDDYWYDLGIDSALKIQREFSANDWAALERIVKIKSPDWVVRCAETFGGGAGEGESAFNILLWMISAGRGIAVKIAALDAINCIVSLGFDVGDKVESIRLAASPVRDAAGGNVVPAVMADFLRKLPK